MTPDITFTLDMTGAHAGDWWRITIKTPAAREFCASDVQACNTHVRHVNIGDTVLRASRAGLRVRCD